MNAELLLQHFERFSEAPDAIPRLRRFILDLAVRGKLVEQDPKDEPASELFQRITEDRSSAIAGASLKPISDFPKAMSRKEWNLPISWVVVPLPSAVYFQEGPGLRNWQFKQSGIPFLNIRTLQDGRVNKSLCQYLDPKEVDSKYRHFLLRKGDIVCSTSGTIGKLAVVRGEDLPLMLNTSIVRFCAYGTHGPLHGFIELFLRTDTFLNQAMESVTGAAQVNMGPKHLKLMAFALPPLAEQQRIVTKADELMALCDQLEAAQTERESRRDRLAASSLNGLNNGTDAGELREHARFYFNHLTRLTTKPEHIQQLRQTILNLAVRGKLVPQDPRNEPASELLKRIQAEKAQRVKGGTRITDTSLPRVDLEQAPFVLPPGWSWARFPELGTFARGKSKHRPRNDFVLFDGGTHLLIQTGDVARSHGVIQTYTNKYNDFGLAQSMKWPAGTLCITIAANIADSGILSFDACFPDSVVGFVPVSMFHNARYFEYFVRTAKANLLEFAPATAQKNINLEILNSVLIPLPPLVEQERIVAKVDELMALCDQLETQLATTRADSSRFLEAVLQEALRSVVQKAA